MYKKQLVVVMNEKESRLITKDVLFYLHDVGTSVLHLHIKVDNKPYTIDSDVDKFRVILRPDTKTSTPTVTYPSVATRIVPSIVPPINTTPVIQDDQTLVNVVGAKEAEIRVDDNILSNEGFNMLMNIEM